MRIEKTGEDRVPAGVAGSLMAAGKGSTVYSCGFRQQMLVLKAETASWPGKRTARNIILPCRFL